MPDTSSHNTGFGGPHDDTFPLLPPMREAVAAASTGNVDISTLDESEELDGVALSANDRVLLKDQTNAKQNGIYIIQANGIAALRSWDWCREVGVPIGAVVAVLDGTTNGQTFWAATAPSGTGLSPCIIPDKHNVAMVQVGGSSSGGDPVLGGDLTGTASNAQIAPGAVGTTELGATSVTAGKIGLGAVSNVHVSPTAGITLSKLENISTAVLLGRSTSGSGAIEQLAAATVRALLALGGAALLEVGTTAGTVAAGDDARLSDTRTPTDGSVTLAKHATQAAGTVIGRATGAGTGTPTALTGAQQAANLAGTDPSFAGLTLTDTDGTGGVVAAAQATVPSTPASGSAAFFMQKICGRSFPCLRGDDGVVQVFEAAPWANRSLRAIPTTGSGFGTIGAWASNGTVSTIAATEALGLMTNIVTNGTGSAQAGVNGTNFEFFRGSASTNGKTNGFWFHGRVYPPDSDYNSAGASTGSRIGIGMESTVVGTALGSDDAASHRALFTRFHVNGGRTDTNWWFSVKDGSTESKVDTGVAFVAQHLYEVWIYCPPAGGTITAWIRDLTSGGSIAEVTRSANLPATTTGLRPMCNVFSVDAVARNIRFTEELFCAGVR